METHGWTSHSPARLQTRLLDCRHVRSRREGRTGPGEAWVWPLRPHVCMLQAAPGLACPLRSCPPTREHPTSPASPSTQAGRSEGRRLCLLESSCSDGVPSCGASRSPCPWHGGTPAPGDGKAYVGPRFAARSPLQHTGGSNPSSAWNSLEPQGGCSPSERSFIPLTGITIGSAHVGFSNIY